MLLAASAEIHLLPNWTFFVQLVIFLTASVTMHLMMIRPIMRTLSSRKKYTVDAEIDAQFLSQKAVFLEQEMEAAIEAALKDAHTKRDEAVLKTKIEADRIKMEAKKDARFLVADAEISVDESEQSLISKMIYQTSSLADEIIKRVSG